MRIGIILTGDYSWAGGVYYALNIIKLLQKISLDRNLELKVLVNRNTAQELIREINLKNVEIVNLDRKSFLYKVWCKCMAFITKSNYRFVSDVNSLKLDLLYPVIHYEKGHEYLNCRVFYWLFDFQHKFLPELFSQEELKKRDLNFRMVTEYARDIVVSSYDSKDHLLQFYPDCKANIHVYNFVSLIEKRENNSSLKMPDNFLVVCNQFWPHKNHLDILKAVKILADQNKHIHIVFTGKYDSVVNKNYVKEIQDFISGNKLEGFFTFTGFIAREEQVGLIQKAKAVVQPSLFEGWSTVIEDAKALNKWLIVSDLPIHREQVKEDVYFFPPGDAQQLSEYLYTVFQREVVKTQSDYSRNIRQSSLDLEKIFMTG